MAIWQRGENESRNTLCVETNGALCNFYLSYLHANGINTQITKLSFNLCYQQKIAFLYLQIWIDSTFAVKHNLHFFKIKYLFKYDCCVLFWIEITIKILLFKKNGLFFESSIFLRISIINVLKNIAICFQTFIIGNHSTFFRYTPYVTQHSGVMYRGIIDDATRSDLVTLKIIMF